MGLACGQCGSENRDDARFCRSCGVLLRVSADQRQAGQACACGHVNLTGRAFCAKCGTRLQLAGRDAALLASHLSDAGSAGTPPPPKVLPSIKSDPAGPATGSHAFEENQGCACGHVNAAGRLFCAKCGTPLQWAEGVAVSPTSASPHDAPATGSPPLEVLPSSESGGARAATARSRADPAPSLPASAMRESSSDVPGGPSGYEFSGKGLGESGILAEASLETSSSTHGAPSPAQGPSPSNAIRDRSAGSAGSRRGSRSHLAVVALVGFVVVAVGAGGWFLWTKREPGVASGLSTRSSQAVPDLPPAAQVHPVGTNTSAPTPAVGLVGSPSPQVVAPPGATARTEAAPIEQAERPQSPPAASPPDRARLERQERDRLAREAMAVRDRQRAEPVQAAQAEAVKRRQAEEASRRGADQAARSTPAPRISAQPSIQSGPQTVEQACSGNTNFVMRQACLVRACLSASNAGDPTCIRHRQMEEERRRNSEIMN